MKIRFWASPIVAAFFVLNCWAQNAPASTPSPNSFLERLTTLTDSDSRPWTAEQFATMGHIRDAAITDPNAYNMPAHLTDNIGPRLIGTYSCFCGVMLLAGCTAAHNETRIASAARLTPIRSGLSCWR